MGKSSVEKVAILGFPGQSIEDFWRVVTFERTFGAPQEQMLDFPVPNCPEIVEKHQLRVESLKSDAFLVVCAGEAGISVS